MSDSQDVTERRSGVEFPDVIDLYGLDQRTDEVLMVMNEPRPWDGSDEQLHQVQEKFNAYASFLLDGELAETHPELAGKKARIELRCAEMPDERGIALLTAIHDQLAMQEIAVEVIAGRDGGGCGEGCSCHAG